MLPFDSEDERFFYSWVLELMDKGIVLSCTNDFDAFPLFESVDITVNKKKINLFRQKTYKPDFKIELNKDFMCFISLDNPNENNNKKIIKKSISNQIALFHKDSVCYVEIKAETKFKKYNNSDIEYNILRKWIYDKHGIFVNTIRPLNKDGLFCNTFTPIDYYDRFYKKDSTKRLKINWEYKSVDAYINNCK